MAALHSRILFVIYLYFTVTFGISNKAGKLIDEEFHRAADQSHKLDQSKAETLQRGIWFVGKNPNYQQSGTPNNNGHDYNDKIPRDARREGILNPDGGQGLYEHSNGGGVSPYGGGIAYGHTGGYNHGGSAHEHGSGVYDHGGGVYDHGGGVYEHASGVYDHGGGVYGHGGDAYDHGQGVYGHGGGVYDHGQGAYDNGGSGYDHGGGSGYGTSGIGEYLRKKLSFKKLFLPLAGVVLVAAALSSTNPVLLQLGTISGNARRERSIQQNENEIVYPANPFVKPLSK